MKKRKAGVYIDRTKTINESSRRPNVVPSAIALQCDNHFKSPHRLFKYKIAVPVENSPSVTSGPAYLTAMMMKNELCVLMFDRQNFADTSVPDIRSIEFTSSLETDAVSGKRKKGAQIIKAGSPICTVNYQSDASQVFLTPVGGQLLELNECNLLSSRLDLLSVYVAVIMPNTVVPTLDGHPNWDSLMNHIQDATTNVCFAFIRGQCNRGDKCKFQHSEQSLVVASACADAVDNEDD